MMHFAVKTNDISKHSLVVEVATHLFRLHSSSASVLLDISIIEAGLLTQGLQPRQCNKSTESHPSGPRAKMTSQGCFSFMNSF